MIFYFRPRAQYMSFRRYGEVYRNTDGNILSTSTSAPADFSFLRIILMSCLAHFFKFLQVLLEQTVSCFMQKFSAKKKKKKKKKKKHYQIKILDFKNCNDSISEFDVGFFLFA